jgi:hypothetical protein
LIELDTGAVALRLYTDSGKRDARNIASAVDAAGTPLPSEKCRKRLDAVGH